MKQMRSICEIYFGSEEGGAKGGGREAAFERSEKAKAEPGEEVLSEAERAARTLSLET